MRIIIFFMWISIQVSIGQVIDASWFLHPDVTLTQVNTFDPDESAFDVSEFGVDQIWDFSSQPTNNLIDTTWFLDPSEMVFSDSFPSATIGRRNVNPFYDWEWYYRIEADTIFDLGFAYERHVGNSRDTFIGPLDNVANYFMIGGFSLGDTLWNSEIKVTRNIFMGTGSVITSSRDTFENCVLIKRESPQFSDIEYRWYQNDLTKEIAVFQPTESASPNASLTWLTSYLWDRPLGTEESFNTAEMLDVKLRQQSIWVNNPLEGKNYQFVFYDFSGRLISSQVNYVSQGESYFDLPATDGLNSIIVLIIDKQSGQFCTKKFIR